MQLNRRFYKLSYRQLGSVKLFWYVGLSSLPYIASDTYSIKMWNNINTFSIHLIWLGVLCNLREEIFQRNKNKEQPSFEKNIIDLYLKFLDIIENVHQSLVWFEQTERAERWKECKNRRAAQKRLWSNEERGCRTVSRKYFTLIFTFLLIWPCYYEILVIKRILLRHYIA